MFTDAQVNEFRELGYIMGPRIYSDAQADELCKRMHDVIEGRSQRQAEASRNLLGDNAPKVVHQVVNIWESDDLFHAHIYQPEICAMTAQLIGNPVLRVWHDQIQYKPPRVGGPTNWHQDHPYWPIIQPADLVSAWTALDDATVANGCMSMVPRSHLWGPHKGGTIGTNDDTFEPTPDLDLLPPDAEITIVPCEVPKGYVMFHHCLTWHGSPCNTSDKGRPAIAVHYMPGYTRYEPVDGHVMEKRVTVKPGETLEGEYFPTVWNDGPVSH